jgi:Copper amine oxidase N-terminal domain
MSARGFAGALIVVLLSATSWAGTKLPTVTHDGRSYVELSRVAASLHTKLDATPASTRAHLRTRDKTVTFTRNWSQVLVNGKPVMLDAPVRVKQGVWLVPESFMGQVVPTLVAGASAGAAPVRTVAAPAEVPL